MDWSQIRAAVVGSGPSGFFVARLLLDRGAHVDMYERLPVPFGLVRHGVAPDHQLIKNVTRTFEKVAGDPRFTFFGGVEVGPDISHGRLAETHHLTVYATGLPRGSDLEIPGENLRGSYSGPDFVGWYNGHPDYAGIVDDLDGDTAVVIGNGNVALDIARVLVLSPDELRASDAPPPVVEMLAGSGLRRVLLVGRRGPREASFTTKELGDLGRLEAASVLFEDTDEILGLAASELEDSRVRGNVEVLQELASAGRVRDADRIIEFRFHAKPIEFCSDAEGRVRTVRLERTDGTAETEDVEARLVFRAVGHRLPTSHDLPRDPGGRHLAHSEGRLLLGQDPILGDYVVGWAKRGPSGVIGTNKQDAADTFRAIEADVAAGRVRKAHAPEDTFDAGAYSWADWQRLDALEREKGTHEGRPRIKFTAVDSMRDALREVAPPAQEVTEEHAHE